MSFVKIWIHVVWSTKNRKPLLKKEVRHHLFEHIHDNAKAKGIMIDSVGGHIDHVHCLFRLRNDQTVSKVIQLIKGESAFWVNKNFLLKEKLVWQSEYFAVSVNESGLDRIRNYIANQEAHHTKSSFQEEYDRLMKDYKFKIF